jgi:hypothetical protein
MAANNNQAPLNIMDWRLQSDRGVREDLSYEIRCRVQIVVQREPFALLLPRAKDTIGKF